MEYKTGATANVEQFMKPGLEFKVSRYQGGIRLLGWLQREERSNSATVCWLLFAAILIGVIVSPMTAGAETLISSGKWLIDGEASMCVLQRQYSSGSVVITVGFRPIPLESKTELVLLTSDLSHDFRRGLARVSMGPNGPPLTVSSDSVFLPTSGQRVTPLYFDLPVEELVKSTELVITAPKIPEMRIAPGGSESAVRAVANCEDRLAESWKVDLAAVRALSRQPAIADAAVLVKFGPSTYPENALRLHKSGRAVAVLTVKADGRVAECRPVVSAGFGELDARTCQIALKLQFQPGLDAAGHPTTSWAVLPVHWSYPY